MFALALFAAAQSGYEVPTDFAVERAGDVAASFIALAFDPAGRAVLSLESGGLMWLEDGDGDGFFEESGTLTEAIEACQGMAFAGEVLYASGRVDGVLGVHRMTRAEDGRAIAGIELVAEVRGDPGEHGAHALRFDADGMLYLMLGDHVRMATEPESASPLAVGYEGSLLPILKDPRGHGHGVVYPGGHVVRMDPATGRWRFHSVGYRNAYDMAFDGHGELLTFDSDMEWAAGLPWYRPVRFLHSVPGGDYGWRKGSGAWPAYYADSLPGLADVGRGSPTGVAYGQSAAFPQRLRDVLFAGDWTEGRILVLHTREAGATYTGEVETLLSSDAGFPVTDLEFGPDGALYFVSGGRGTVGRFEKLVYLGTPEPLVRGRPVRRPTWLGTEPERAADQLTDPDPFTVRRALEALLYADEVPPSAAGAICELLGHGDRWVRYAAMRVQRHHGTCASPVELRARIQHRIASRGGDESPYLEDEVVVEPELLVEFLRALQLGEPELASLRNMPELAVLLPHSDPRVSRELAVLLAAVAPEDAVERLVQALESEEDRAQQIHYAYCLSALEAGWTDSELRRVFLWFEGAAAWTGGLSFAQSLAALRERIADRLSAEERTELALKAPKRERLGLRTVVAFLEGLGADEIGRLVPAFQYGWARAEEVDRVAALADLTEVESPELLAFLRRQAENVDAPRDAVLTALARIGAADDYLRFVDGLSRKSSDVRVACAEALLEIDRRPERSAEFRDVLELARRQGNQRGFVYLRLLAHWAGEPVPREAPEDWDGALAGWERWGAARFPEFRVEEVDDTRRPTWGFEATLAFLDRSAERSGSAARGREVYERATCGGCHVLGGYSSPALTGFGPDLHGVTRRFSQRDLLETIVFPSKAIAGLYQTTVVVTVDGDRYEGRRVDDGDDGDVRLLGTDGEHDVIPRADVAELRASEVSTMPEGLLAPFTLEEVKDLVAFLRAEAEVEAEPGPAWEPLFEEEARNLWEGDEILWRIRGGVLIGRSRGLERNDYLASKVAWSDFELELDVKLADGEGNTGLQYRSRLAPDQPDPLGYQLDLGQAGWGSLFATDGRGVVAAPDEELWREVVDGDGWNHVHLRAVGARHVIELNGRVTVDVEDRAFADGVLAFQLHQGEPMGVRFANVRVRPLR